MVMREQEHDGAVKWKTSIVMGDQDQQNDDERPVTVTGDSECRGQESVW